jgi:lipopolysaccharide/colanic/teichoic acid biosynthesis glycosyltransferase
MSQILTASELVQTEELLTVGLPKDFGQFIKKNSPLTKPLRPRKFESSFSAYRWLVHCSKAEFEHRLPKAIICDFELLKDEQALFFKNVAGHPQLKFIPFIVFNSTKKDVRYEALDLGVDDCYNSPIEGDYLCDRIEFLAKYKPQFASSKLARTEDYIFKIPRSKRILDIVISSAALILISPILLLTALIIKLTSKGPIIYRSQRVGTGYQVFDFLKFRSMYVDADKRLKELEHLNQYSHKTKNGKNGNSSKSKNGKKTNGVLFQKFKNDPRVTTIGRFIRKTSIDELPQLINVLKGEMSIVGNRPLPLYEAEQLTRDAWAQRFRAPAGITGLWQISKRGKDNMSAEERIALDIQYSENYSFWYDLKIILKTPFAMFQEEDV